MLVCQQLLLQLIGCLLTAHTYGDHGPSLHKGCTTYSSAHWWSPCLHFPETREGHIPEYKTKQKFWYPPKTSSIEQCFRISDRNNSNVQKNNRHKVICEGSKLHLQGYFSPQNKPLLTTQMTAPRTGNGCYKSCLFSA